MASRPNKPIKESNDGKAEKKSGKARLVIIIVAVLLLGGAGGAAAWYYGQLQSTPAPKIPVFLSLETFTVNLEPENSDQHLQTNLTLKVGDNEAVKQDQTAHAGGAQSRLAAALQQDSLADRHGRGKKETRHGTVGGDKPAL